MMVCFIFSFEISHGAQSYSCRSGCSIRKRLWGDPRGWQSLHPSFKLPIWRLSRTNPSHHSQRPFFVSQLVTGAFRRSPEVSELSKHHVCTDYGAMSHSWLYLYIWKSNNAVLGRVSSHSCVPKKNRLC